MPVRRAARPGTASYPGPAACSSRAEPTSEQGESGRSLHLSMRCLSRTGGIREVSLQSSLASSLGLFFSLRRATSPLRPAPLPTLPCPRQRSPSASASQNFLLPGASIPRSADVPSWLSDGFRSPPPAWLPPSLALFARGPCCPPALVPRSPLSLTLSLSLRSAPFPWLPLPLADCYAVCS